MRNCTDSGMSYSCLKNSTITRKLLMKSCTGQVGDPVFARFIPWVFYILDAGFCEHLVTANLVGDKLFAANRPLWIVSLDLSKAFDRINWDALWQSLLGTWRLCAYGVDFAITVL